MRKMVAAAASVSLAVAGLVLSAGPASANLPAPGGGGCSGHRVLDATSYKKIDPRTVVYVPGRDVLLVNCTSKTYIVNVRCANPAKISSNGVCWTKRVRPESTLKVSIPPWKAYTSSSWYSA